MKEQEKKDFNKIKRRFEKANNRYESGKLSKENYNKALLLLRTALVKCQNQYEH